jgi:hypothetical protein
MIVDLIKSFNSNKNITIKEALQIVISNTPPPYMIYMNGDPLCKVCPGDTIDSLIPQLTWTVDIRLNKVWKYGHSKFIMEYTGDLDYANGLR